MTATTLSVFAQGDDKGRDTAPPPVRVLSRSDRERLDTKRDVKDRTKLALEMMSERLTSAEKLMTSEEFDAVFRELGYFHGLMENSVDFLERRDTGSGKVLDNFKRLEMGLRAFLPRLETIRREIPNRYEDYVGIVMKYLRDARSKAFEPMFSDTVLPPKKPGL